MEVASSGHTSGIVRRTSAPLRLGARAGKAFGVVLIVVGLLEIFTTESGCRGLWLLFLGWFFVQAAQSESSAMQVRSLFGDKLVRDVMTLDPAHDSTRTGR